MSLLDQVINYCERTDHSFWSEPINAVTNIAFLIAACALYKEYKAQNMRDRPIFILTILIAVVGTGSFIFHTFATKLAMLLDVIPIVVFVGYYIYVAFTRMLHWKPLSAVALVAAFVFFGAYADGNIPPPYNLNGSIAYLPCLGIIIFIWLKSQNKTYRTAAFVFALSLTFRTIDMQICTSISIGTHFLWHCLNGLVLYLLVKALIQSAKPAN